MFSPTDRNLLATITDKKSMLFFDVRSGKRTNTITPRVRHQHGMESGRTIRRRAGNKSDVLLLLIPRKEKS